MQRGSWICLVKIISEVLIKLTNITRLACFYLDTQGGTLKNVTDTQMGWEFTYGPENLSVHFLLLISEQPL